MDTLHQVHDMAKAQALAEAMDRDGWQGPPLVADGDQLITGVHRYHAWTRLCERAVSDIPIIDIRDICCGQGLDYDALMERDDIADLDWWERLLIIVRENLPAGVLAQYGIDVE